VAQQLGRKRTGSGTILLAYVIYVGNMLAIQFAALLPFLAFSRTSYFSLLPNSIFLVMLMGSVTLKLREHFQALDALRFRSERLEAELLKKSIQPHFIMNTLLSIKSYLGIDSARAERLIEALAEEFRLINRISKQGEIPLAEELNLCRLHLELMGYRRDARYELVTAGDCQGFSIPPMVLHTLVENGLTHAFKPKESGTFRFSCARQGRTSVYLMENDGANLGERLADAGSQQAEEGLGLRYVRARLEEAYPGKWRLDYGLRQGAWTVRIDIEAP
jgi:sensor histidine kinase YesM